MSSITKAQIVDELENADWKTKQSLLATVVGPKGKTLADNVEQAFFELMKDYRYFNRSDQDHVNNGNLGNLNNSNRFYDKDSKGKYVATVGLLVSHPDELGNDKPHLRRFGPDAVVVFFGEKDPNKLFPVEWRKYDGKKVAKSQSYNPMSYMEVDREVRGDFILDATQTDFSLDDEKPDILKQMLKKHGFDYKDIRARRHTPQVVHDQGLWYDAVSVKSGQKDFFTKLENALVASRLERELAKGEVDSPAKLERTIRTKVEQDLWGDLAKEKIVSGARTA
jgi:hypothetical protein